MIYLDYDTLTKKNGECEEDELHVDTMKLNDHVVYYNEQKNAQLNKRKNTKVNLKQ